VAIDNSMAQFLSTRHTEVKLVAIENSMAQVMWTRNFWEVQGQFVPTTTIYQDYKSLIQLAENGKTSSSNRMPHLDIRYFLVVDKIQKGEVEFAFCPTHE